MINTYRQLLEQLIAWDDQWGADDNPDLDALDTLIQNARTALAPPKQPTTQREIMAEMFQIRDAKAELSAAEKELNGRWGDLENLLIAKMDEQGASRVSSAALGTAVLTDTIVPQFVDADAFFDYVAEHKAFHLLQRRINNAAYRELVNAKQDVPGLAPFNKRSINLRAN